ncbi:MAG: serine/threonine protein kinase [Myxococcales bacterium]|nr:serine/threonine protein kinase [Myxococcales bacterium]
MSVPDADIDPDKELEEIAEARIGRILCAKWTLDEVLGVGGMAAVYGATHRNGKRVAIKMLHPQLSYSPTLRRRFLREGYVANAVGHPGAVGVDDDDVDEDGTAFLVMERLEGKPLDVIADAGPLPPLEVIRLAIQLLEVLEPAHDNGVVHRDIKPANLFVTNAGELKVLDFGVARLRDHAAFNASLTRSGAVIGTPAFMAPEQALGDRDGIGPHTDLWAVGATMFFLASGEVVHRAETMSELISKVASHRAPSLATVADGAPPGLVAIVDKALAHKIEDRWQNAANMREALVALLAELTDAPVPAADDATTEDRAEMTRDSAPEDDEEPSAVVAHGRAVSSAAAFAHTEPGRVEELTPARRPRLWLAIATAAIAAVLVALTISAEPEGPGPAEPNADGEQTAAVPVEIDAPPVPAPATIAGSSAPSPNESEGGATPTPTPPSVPPTPAVTIHAPPRPTPPTPSPQQTDRELFRQRH